MVAPPQTSRPWRLAIAGAMLLATVLGLTARLAAADVPVPPRIDALYAEFTINLTRFITWPEGALGPAGTPFVIGTFSGDAINAQLDALARGESVDGHPIRTVRIRGAADAQRCQLVYVSKGMADLRPLLGPLRQRPVLLVSDAENVLRCGGHVHFAPGGSQVQLRVSVENLRASGLEARAQLLRLAELP